MGTVWATLIAYLTHHFEEKIFTNSLIKNGLVMLISIGIVYALIISLAGIVPTKIASVQG
jgi:small basic protein